MLGRHDECIATMESLRTLAIREDRRLPLLASTSIPSSGAATATPANSMPRASSSCASRCAATRCATMPASSRTSPTSHRCTATPATASARWTKPVPRWRCCAAAWARATRSASSCCATCAPCNASRATSVAPNANAPRPSHWPPTCTARSTTPPSTRAGSSPRSTSTRGASSRRKRSSRTPSAGWSRGWAPTIRTSRNYNSSGIVAGSAATATRRWATQRSVASGAMPPAGHVASVLFNQAMVLHDVGRHRSQAHARGSAAHPARTLRRPPRAGRRCAALWAKSTRPWRRGAGQRHAAESRAATREATPDIRTPCARRCRWRTSMPSAATRRRWRD